MSRATRSWSFLLVVSMILAAGCARSPEAQKARYLTLGDKYFEKGRYREAILEYRNAVRLEATNPHAIRHLGLSHFQLGELDPAFRFLLKAKELDPDNLTTSAPRLCRMA